jgi:hypothetical protein
MGWNYIGLLFVANNYGTKGAQAFQRAAYAQGICVAQNFSISVNPSKIDQKDLYDAYIGLIQQGVKVSVCSWDWDIIM